MKKYSPVLYVAFANILWGINVPIVKIGIQEVPLFFYGTLKMTIALAVVSTMLRGHWKKLDIRTWAYVVVSGLLLGFFANALYYFGLYHVSGLLGSVIMLITPLLVFFFSVEFLKEGISVRNITGLFFAAAGAILVVLSPVAANQVAISAESIGVVALILGAILAAVGTVAAKPALSKATPQQETFMRILFAWAGYSICTVALNQWQPLNEISATGWVSLILSTVIVISATVLFNNGLKNISGEEAGLLDYLRPVFGIVASILLLSESPSTGFLLGALLVFFGTYITEIRLPLRLHGHHHHH